MHFSAWVLKTWAGLWFTNMNGKVSLSRKAFFLAEPFSPVHQRGPYQNYQQSRLCPTAHLWGSALDTLHWRRQCGVVERIWAVRVRLKGMLYHLLAQLGQASVFSSFVQSIDICWAPIWGKALAGHWRFSSVAPSRSWFLLAGSLELSGEDGWET